MFIYRIRMEWGDLGDVDTCVIAATPEDAFLELHDRICPKADFYLEDFKDANVVKLGDATDFPGLPGVQILKHT